MTTNKKEETDVTGNFPANVERDVRTIFIHCSLVTEPYSDDPNSELMVKIIYSYTYIPNKEPNFCLLLSPKPMEKFEIQYSEIMECSIKL